MLHLGILKTWNSTTHKAGVQLVGSLTTYLDNINVAINIAPQAMVVGNYVLVAIPGGNPRDACVVASWPAGSSGGGGGVTDHGADKHTDVTRYLWIPAVVGYAGTGTPGYQYYYSVVSGGANEPAPTVYWTLKAPSDFVSLVSVKALWTSPAASGSMYWKLSAYYGAAGENIGAHTDWPAYGTTATAGNMKWNLQEPAYPLTLSSLTKDDFIGIRFIRVGSDPSDTLENTVYFAGLLFTYIAEQ